MEQRVLGKTGRRIGVVGLGAWQIGADWGPVSDADAMATLHAAVDAGVTFVDTADVYGDGRSERLIGRFRHQRPDAGLTVATKMGRRAQPHRSAAYTLDSFRAWTDRSRANLGGGILDLVQLHCPPSDVYSRDAVFDALDVLVAEGRIAAYGVSVETCAEALAALERPGVATIQIILNCFRQKPLDAVLPAARAAGVGIIARVPLASGLLAGGYDESTTFPPEDHRAYNRNGEAFDVGETFAGVPYEAGLAAVEELRALVPPGMTMAQLALRWILMQEAVTTVIAGAKSTVQAQENAAASDLPRLPAETMTRIATLYDTRIRPFVHQRW